MARILGEHFKADGKPKRGFLSLAQAKRFVRDHNITNVTPYECTFCNKYHLATDKQEEER